MTALAKDRTSERSADRPSLADLGLTPLAIILIDIELIVIMACVFLYPALHLTFSWRSTPSVIAVALAPWALWGYFVWQPGRQPLDWVIAERCIIVSLLLVMFVVHPQAQYLALALKRPLIGHALATADARLGIDVSHLAEWTRTHPMLRLVLTRCYATLLWQFWLPLIVLWWSKQDREDLWEYVTLFCATSIVTLSVLAVWPAEPPLAVYHFRPLLNQSHVWEQIAQLRSGELRNIDIDHLDGLVSFPSFHTIGALLVTWALRHKRAVWPFVALLNVGVLAATILLGMHYAVDVYAGVCIFLLAVRMKRAILLLSVLTGG